MVIPVLFRAVVCHAIYAHFPTINSKTANCSIFGYSLSSYQTTCQYQKFYTPFSHYAIYQLGLLFASINLFIYSHFLELCFPFDTVRILFSTFSYAFLFIASAYLYFSAIIISMLWYFRRIRKSARSDTWLCNACLFLRPSTRNNSVTTGRIFMKFDIYAFFERV